MSSATAIADALPGGLDLDAFHDLQPGDSRRLRKLLRTAWNDLRDKHKYEIVVIMLDNLERARPNFLTSVRDVFQRLTIEGASYMLVFAGRVLPSVGTHSSDPVARFFNPRIPLHAFDEATGIEAIKKPVRFLPSFSFTDDAARLIHGRAAGHPHFLKLICHHVYDSAEGKEAVDGTRLEELWPEIEERLVDDRFGRQFTELSDGEQTTLLHASLLGPEFQVRELRGTIRSLDTFLDRLRKAELLRTVQRGMCSGEEARYSRPVLPGPRGSNVGEREAGREGTDSDGRGRGIVLKDRVAPQGTRTGSAQANRGSRMARESRGQASSLALPWTYQGL